MNRRRKNIDFTNRVTFPGPNLYIDQQAIRFEIKAPPSLPETGFLWERIVDRFPKLGGEAKPGNLAELAASTVSQKSCPR